MSMDAFIDRIDALCDDPEAADWVERCDPLMTELTQVAAKPTPATAALLVPLESLVLVFADRLRKDAWQLRVLVQILAQLHEAVGAPADAARWWSRFAALAPHRAGEVEAAPVADATAFTATVDRFLAHYLGPLSGGLRPFDGVPHDVIAALGEALGPSFLDREHNACPSPRTLLGASEQATFDGHVVVPPRRDFRVDVVAVTLPTSAVPADWKRSADEVDVRGDETYLWWD